MDRLKLIKNLRKIAKDKGLDIVKVREALPGDTYHVRATPGAGWWGITVDELDTVFAQTRRFEDVEAEARSAIAFWFDVDESRVGGIVVTAAEVAAG